MEIQVPNFRRRFLACRSGFITGLTTSHLKVWFQPLQVRSQAARQIGPVRVLQLYIYHVTQPPGTVITAQAAATEGGGHRRFCSTHASPIHLPLHIAFTNVQNCTHQNPSAGNASDLAGQVDFSDVVLAHASYLPGSTVASPRSNPRCVPMIEVTLPSPSTSARSTRPGFSWRRPGRRGSAAN